MSLYVTSKDLSLPIEITQKEMEDKEKGTSRSDFFWGNKQYVLVNIPCRQWKRVLAPAAVGAGVGAVLGGVGGFAVAGPVGIVPGAALGATIVGGTMAVTAVGLVYAKVPYMLLIDPRYHEWRVVKQGENLLNLFDRQVREHNELTALQCPIYADFPRIPVRAPCGHVYDKDSIERHLDGIYAAKSSCSSLEGFHFTKADLHFYPEHLIDIMKTCVQVRTIIQAGMEGRILREGLDAVYASSQNMAHQDMTVKITTIMKTSQQPGMKISSKDIRKEILKICDQYMVQEESDEKESLSLK